MQSPYSPMQSPYYPMQSPSPPMQSPFLSMRSLFPARDAIRASAWESFRLNDVRGFRRQTSDPDVLHGVAASCEEPVEIGPRQDECPRVDVRMTRHPLGGTQVPVDHNPDPRGGPQVPVEHNANRVCRIIDQSKRRHRTGRQPEMSHQPLRRREAELAVADLLGHRAEIRFLRMQQHDEVVPVPFRIPQKQV